MAALAGFRFLVVDDMMTMRKIISAQLKNLGATVIAEANDGSTAWEAMQKVAATEPVQFVISDWNMPTLKGIDLLRQCRLDPVYKNVAFLLVTAESELGQVAEALQAGVDNYLVKPFTPQMFQEKFSSVWKKRFGGQ
ncbi:MAG: response regulator [Bdellovibrionota bacterium]